MSVSSQDATVDMMIEVAPQLQTPLINAVLDPEFVCYNRAGSHSWSVLGAGFKPVARISVRGWVRLPLASAILSFYRSMSYRNLLACLYPISSFPACNSI